MAKNVRNNRGNIKSQKKVKRNVNFKRGGLKTKGNLKNRVNTFRSEALTPKGKPKLKAGIRKRNILQTRLPNPNQKRVSFNRQRNTPNSRLNPNQQNQKRVTLNRQGIAARIANILANRPSTSTSRPNNKIMDARQKLIQKKRAGVRDARDVLAKKARSQDARTKITGMGMVADRIVSGGRSDVKIIGSNIVQKVDRNGKISLVTNKNGRNTCDINLAIQKELGLLDTTKPAVKLRRPNPVRRPQVPRQNQSPKGALKGPLPLRKTILNEMEYGPVEPPIYAPDTYKWAKPDLRPASHMISELDSTRQALRDVMREELLLANSRNVYQEMVHARPAKPRAPLRLQPATYINLIDDDEEMDYTPTRISLQGSTRMSNVHSRLDAGPSSAMSHGILANTKTKVVVPAGHRIVVSNLQSTVTEDDIKELFEDIGHLLSAKLIRTGVAEVIYKNLADAQKAVETYHNRQLDGQPMKCLLVNKQRLGPSNPVIKAEGDRKSSAPPANRLVPDIDTIHKVLFQRK